MHLDFVVDQTVLLTPAPCLSSLKYLTELQLSSHVNLPVTLGTACPLPAAAGIAIWGLHEILARTFRDSLAITRVTKDLKFLTSLSYAIYLTDRLGFCLLPH